MTSKQISNIALLVMIFLFMVIVTGANLQNTDIGLVSSRSLDEYAFFGVLNKMLLAFDQHNWHEFLNIVFVNYGFPYFFLQWLITFPLFRGNMFDAVLFVMREFSMIWAVGYVVLSYIWVQKRSGSNLAALFCATVLLSQPGMWAEAMNIHPDHMMTFFIILVLMYLDWQTELKSWKVLSIAGFIYAFALSAKFQAIIYFLPIMLILAWDVYTIKSTHSEKTIPVWKDISRYRDLAHRIWRFLSVTIVSYVILNPYMLASWGRSNFVNLFIQNMKSNATNHFSYVIPSIEDKLNMLSMYFFTPILMTILVVVAAINVGWIASGNQRRTGIALLVSSVLIFLYIFSTVNKIWPHYYLTVFVLLPISLLLSLRSINGKVQTNIFTIASLLLTGLMSFNAASNITEIIDQRVREEHEDINRSNNIIAAILEKVSNNSHIVISPKTPFKFSQLNIPYSNIHVIWGPLTRKYATQGDVLIIRKDDTYFTDKLPKGDNNTAKQYQNARVFLDEIIAGSNYMFESCAETELVFIFCRKHTSQNEFGELSESTSASIKHEFLKIPINLYDSRKIIWSDLTYSTRIFLFFSFFADIKFSAVRSRDLIPNLMNSIHGEGKIPKYDQSLQIVINSEVFGRKHRVEGWFDSDLTILQKSHLKTGGSRYRQKTIRFADNSVFFIEKTPINENEKQLPAKEWTGISEDILTSQSVNIGQNITDFSALFYAISASELNNLGDNLTLLAWTKGKLIQIKAEATEIVDILIDYREESNEIKGNNKALKINLLFNEQGNLSNDMLVDWVQSVNIYMDPETRLIHKIGVKVDFLGTIDIELDKVSLR